MKDINEIRKDFPILEKKIYNKPLVYLDNAATTQKPISVVQKIEDGYYNANANIHRGVHFLSQEATEAHEQARQKVADFLNANSSKEIIFTRGTTESINLVVSSYGEAFLKKGDEVIVSQMEHHANIVPWQMLRDKIGIVIKVIPLNSNQELDIEEYKKLITDKTKFVSISHVSNVLGTINPVKEIISIAHLNNIPVLVDGAQSVPHIKIDIKELDADFFVFSGHKIYGPTGIGVLYGKEKLLDNMPPYQGGGEMIANVSFEKTTYNELPYKFEAGTPDYIGSTALSTALEYIEKIGIDNIAHYEHELLSYATSELLKISGVKIFGNAKEKSSVLSFLIDGIHHYDMGLLLDKQGIAVRTGHHCAQPLMTYLGVEGTVRASFSFYNTKDEIDIFIKGVKRVVQMFQ
ncbi:MAG: cysteine desulfurase [Bacteroidales bacterium]|nr:cysteine desulfurase [Bacteroidales bacterium]